MINLEKGALHCTQEIQKGVLLVSLSFRHEYSQLI